MDFGIKDKVAIVTGANRKGALGDVIAKALAAEGAVIACVDIVAKGAEAVADDINNAGGKAKAYGADQSRHEQVVEAVGKIKTELGPPSILINNAALLRGGGRIQKIPLEDWHRLIEVDLDGPYYWVREVWDSMQEQGWGRIINIASIAAIMGGFGQANYAAAKAGVIAMAKTAALEGARAGITANAVTLGIVNTLGEDPDNAPLQTGEVFDRIKAKIAMREFAMPQDVAGMVTFLASQQARYITGQSIHVMGGLDLFTY